MGLNIGGNIKSIYLGGNIKEGYVGSHKVFSSGGDEGLIYKTDFSNFDETNLVDTPIIGNDTQWVVSRQTAQKTKIDINGTQYNALYVKGGVIYSDQIPTEDIFTIEFDVYKPTFSGLFGGISFIESASYFPMWNCWNADRGMGIYTGYPHTLYNGVYQFMTRSYAATWYNKNEVGSIITWGISVNKNLNVAKVYINGKKMLVCGINSFNNGRLSVISDNSYSWALLEFYLLGFRITSNDKFDTMEEP